MSMLARLLNTYSNKFVKGQTKKTISDIYWEDPKPGKNKARSKNLLKLSIQMISKVEDKVGLENLDVNSRHLLRIIHESSH